METAGKTREAWRERLAGAKTIVIKIGSSLLTQSSGLDKNYIFDLCARVAELRRGGKRVILVSSGAVAAGRLAVNDGNGPAAVGESLPRKQALSAIGQPRLIQYYQEFLAEQGLLAAQVLITESNVHSRREYLNLQDTFHELSRMEDVVPIVNENDSVATRELRFGDNDVLSATVLSLAGADLLLILTRVEGFLVDGERLPEVSRVTPVLMEHAGGPSGPGSGGMITKLQGARMALRSGALCGIVDGRDLNNINEFLAGKDVGTLFTGQTERIRGRKRWILFSRRLRGVLRVDEGAARALMEKQTSLLAVGVTTCEGDFRRGDLVEIVDGRGRGLGRGICNYDREDMDKIRGLATPDIRRTLPDRFFNEVIHKDNLVTEPEPM